MTVRPTVAKICSASASCSVGDEVAAADGRDAGADHGGCIRHGANDGEIAAGGFFDGAGLDRGGEGDQQLAGAKCRGDSADDVVQLLRLDAQQDDVGIFGGVEVVRGDRDAKLFGEGSGAGFVGDGGGYVLAGKEAGAQECLNQDAAHLAGAKDGDAEAGSGLRCSNYSDVSVEVMQQGYQSAGRARLAKCGRTPGGQQRFARGLAHHPQIGRVEGSGAVGSRVGRECRACGRGWSG